MHRTLRALLATVALLALPQLAAAGPIQWGYRATSTVLGDEGTVLREMSGITETEYGDYFWRDPLQFGVYLPDQRPDNSLHTDTWSQQAMVTVTDELLGQSVNFMMTLDYVRQYEIESDGTLNPIYEGYRGDPWPDPLRFTLGANEYSVRSPGGEFLVSIEPGVATPEPGTFALGALGLCALGVVRRAKKGRSAIM
jgi:hypothetical protein